MLFVFLLPLMLVNKVYHNQETSTPPQERCTKKYRPKGHLTDASPGNAFIDEPTLQQLCGRPPQYAPAPCKLTFDLLTLEVVSESRVT